MVACHCKVCQSNDPRDQRTRASILVDHQNTRLLVDASADFRTQALRCGLTHLDGVLLTHAHSDHIGGIDDLRGITFSRQTPLPLYGTEKTLKEVQIRFSYLFSGKPAEGGTIARLETHTLPNVPSTQKFGSLDVLSFPLPHGSSSVLGYRFGKAAYLTDLHQIPDEIFPLLEGLELLILDCARVAPHRTHLHYDQSLQYATRINAKKTVLTHLGHDFGFEVWQKKCPPGIELGVDGAEYTLTEP